MSKYIKKVVYLLAIFSLFIGTTSFAAFSFNSDPNDCNPFIGIANYDSRAGWPDSRGCWKTSNVSAQPGEYINVGLYYHNTGSASEPNVKIKLTNPGTGPSTNYSFSGTISSPNGSKSLGTVYLNVPSNQTLTYVDTAWYDQARGFDAGDEITITSSTDIFNSGFNLGTVGLGWPSQGYVVVKFLVGKSTPPPPPTTFCQVTEFRADPSSTIYSGQPVVLRWNTIGASSVTIDGIQGGPNDSKTVFPSSTRTYTIVANCSNGQSVSRQVQVYVDNYYPQNDNRPTATTQTPRNIDEDSATLRGSINGNGSRIDGWFEMPCRSGDRYGQVYDVYDTDISYNRRGLRADRRYEYCAVARNNSTGVTDYGAEVSFYTEDDDYNDNDDLDITTNNATNVSTTSARLNGYIDTNDSNTTRWFRYGTTTSSMYLTTNTTNHGSGGRSFSDYVYNLAPNTTYYYQAVASDRDGTHYDANIKSFNTNASIINNVSTSAVTTVATNVSTTGAQLNGLLMNTSGLSTSTYFEYGTTVNLGSRTASKTVAQGTSIPFSDFVSGLAPNTIYFFRANAENGNGRVYGDIKIFKTLATTVVPPATVIKTVTTRVGTDSPIMLKIENKYEIFRIGDIVDYTVTYENIGDETLTNPLLQVILPAHVQYRNSSRGTFAFESNTLSVPLQDLKAKDGGVVYVQGQVVSLPENRSEIVTTALLAYTNPNGAQEDAMAYVLNRDDGMVITNNNLSANALFASGFLPGDLCGWLLIIIAILLMALLIRWLLGDRNTKNSQ